VKYADLGQFLRDADKVARIYSVDSAEVRLPLPIEKTKFLDLPLDYSNEASAGSHPIILTATFGGREFQWEAQLDRVEGEIDSRTRMIHIVAKVDQPYAKDPAHPERPPLAVGMFVQAEIRGRSISNTVSLPREIMHGRDQALIISKNGEDGTYRISFRDVVVIQRNESTVVIQDGLQTGELVCASPLSIVTSDMQVRLATIFNKAKGFRSILMSAFSRAQNLSKFQLNKYEKHCFMVRQKPGSLQPLDDFYRCGWPGFHPYY